MVMYKIDRRGGGLGGVQKLYTRTDPPTAFIFVNSALEHTMLGIRRCKTIWRENIRIISQQLPNLLGSESLVSTERHWRGVWGSNWEPSPAVNSLEPAGLQAALWEVQREWGKTDIEAPVLISADNRRDEGLKTLERIQLIVVEQTVVQGFIGLWRQRSTNQFC